MAINAISILTRDSLVSQWELSVSLEVLLHLCRFGSELLLGKRESEWGVCACVNVCSL